MLLTFPKSVMVNKVFANYSSLMIPVVSCHQHRRHKSSLSVKRLVYSNFGDPESVLKYEEVETANPGDKLVIKMLASPINPADINTIQGNYPIKPKVFPAVGGMEGVGIVTAVGPGRNPYYLSEGDWVIPKNPCSGTWQSQIFAENDEYLRILKTDVISAATISVNPCIAYRLLKDYGFKTDPTQGWYGNNEYFPTFGERPGDIVIQNGGNSSVGRAVIQLCREFGCKSISIVRNCENIAELKKELEDLGDSNTLVLTDEEFRLKAKELTTQLALNCVGGEVATDMLRTLDNGGIMVTYDGMASQPMIVPTSLLTFKRVSLQGFWMARWNEDFGDIDTDERLSMLNYLGELCLEGCFKPPNCKLIPIQDYKEAFKKTTGFTNTTLMFTFD